MASARRFASSLPTIYSYSWSTSITLHKSKFLGHAAFLSDSSAVDPFLAQLKASPALKRATHCMYAWRSSSGGLSGQSDGGESGAGDRLTRLLGHRDSECTIIVVVSRWYGGTPLGSARWKLISGVAKEALEELLASRRLEKIVKKKGKK